MFRAPVRKTPMAGFPAMLVLVFHAAVRNIRKTNHNAILGLVVNISQSVVLVLVMYTMFTVLKMRGSDHAKGLWQFEVGEHGLTVGEQLTGLTGVLGWSALRGDPTGDRGNGAAR